MTNIPVTHDNHLIFFFFKEKKKPHPIVLLKWHMINIKNFNAKMNVLKLPILRVAEIHSKYLFISMRMHVSWGGNEQVDRYRCEINTVATPAHHGWGFKGKQRVSPHLRFKRQARTKRNGRTGSSLDECFLTGRYYFSKAFSKITNILWKH